MNIYHKVVSGGHGLSVSIDRQGVNVAEMTPVEGLIEKPEGRYLVQTASFSWDKFRNRQRCYSGDNGAGRMRARLVAGAISLLAYWGGDESWLNRQRDFEEV